MKIIEFFGVPGVGKSFLAETAVPNNYCKPLSLYNNGNKVVRCLKKIALLLRHFPTTISSFFWITKFIKSFRSIEMGRCWKVFFNFLFIDALIRDAAQARYDQVVLDQGFAQGLWSMLFRANEQYSSEVLSTFVKEFLERLPISDWTVIHVIASQETIVSRLSNRFGFSPLDQNTSELPEAICTEKIVEQTLNNLSEFSMTTKVVMVRFLNDRDDCELDFFSLIDVN